MKTFKQFVNKKKNNDDDFVVLSDVIHFKAGVDDKHNADPEFEPSVKKDKGHYVKEERRWGNFADWLDKNDNEHLGESHEEVADVLKPPAELNSEEKNVIQNHSVSSVDLNKALIGKDKKFLENPKNQDNINRLDSITDEHRAQHSHTLYSGLTFDPRTKLEGKKRFISPAYISATHDKIIANNFTKPIANLDAPEHKTVSELPKMHKTLHILQMQVPVGARAAHISQASTIKSEYETLIGRNSKFEYSHSEPYVDQFGNNYLIHHARMLP